MQHYPLYLANEAKETDDKLEITDKYTNSSVYTCSLGNSALITKAFDKAEQALLDSKKMSSWERHEILLDVKDKLEANQDEFAKVLAIEAGKPIAIAKSEVLRAIATFNFAAGEALNIQGEVIPVDTTAWTKGYIGMVKREPIGICSLISPFNFPLNLVAHKVAPAIAAGCPFVLKPASLTPICSLMLGEILSNTALPKGFFSIIPAARTDSAPMVEDPRIKLLTFTGSDSVGWQLKSRVTYPRVILELGGNAACIVDDGVDVEKVAGKVASGAFAFAGQSCISVQRVYVHAKIYDDFKTELLKAAKNLVIGDPKEDKTVIGPVISEKEAIRILAQVQEAVDNGANLLLGGNRKNNLVEPTIIENVSDDLAVVNEEVFGPVAVLNKFDDINDVINRVNNSRYGLQVGIFTNNLDYALKSWDKINTGGVVINEIPSWRVDNMPYGGIKDSGIGREGLKDAISDMLEKKLLIINKN